MNIARAIAVARPGDGPVHQENLLSAQSRRHIEMRVAVLKAHPEAVQLAGPDWRGLIGAILLLAIHWTAIWLVSRTDIFVVFFAAFFFGQLVLHSVGSLIHETAHRLVFRERRAKLAFDLLLEVITTSFGRQLTYQHEHVSSHHPHLGNYERDYEHEDLCRFLARRAHRAKNPKLQHWLTLAELIVQAMPLGFMISNKIFNPFYRKRTGRATKDRQRRIGATKAPDAERRVFIAVSIATNLFLFGAFGFLGWLYHIWSLSLFLGKCGITNLGQSLSEHPGDDERAPTRSSYSALNLILFNTGYHNEHHTFPNVAWTRLPKLKRLAPDVFGPGVGKSYVGFWWAHVRDDFSPSRRTPLHDQDQSIRCSNAPANI
jgi:sphingolipid delta-4 desaturase